MIEQALALEFGRDGNAENYLGGGWSTGEAGFRWMVGESSELWLENPGATGHVILELDLRPFVRPPELPAQRLVVSVHGVEIGRATVVNGGLLGWHVPAALLAGPGRVRVIFQHPDARPPNELSDASDDRPLAISVHSARVFRVPEAVGQSPAVTSAPADWTCWAGGLPVVAGTAGRPTPRFDIPVDIPAADLVMRFESLGDNCEFGLVQRRCGKEPLGLLRFANIMLPSLLRGVRSGFANLGDLETLQFWDEEKTKEYVIRDMDYGLTYHTFLYRDQVTETGLLDRQSARLKFLAQKLLEDIGAAEKIFVVKRNETLLETEILPLYAALRARGKSTLMWVVPADEHHAAGNVEVMLPGLLKGRIDRFAPYENAHDLSLTGWLELCRQAHNLTFDTEFDKVLFPGEHVRAAISADVAADERADAASAASGAVEFNPVDGQT